MFWYSAMTHVSTLIVMQLRYQFRIDPAPAQCITLAKVFGCARVVYSDGLRMCLEADEAGHRIPSEEADRAPGV